MPARLLPIEHCLQDSGAGCLAACSQMVLRYLGIEQSQRRLNRLLGLTSLGVPYSHLSRLAPLGVQIAINVGDETHLQQAIDRDLPPFVFSSPGIYPIGR